MAVTRIFVTGGTGLLGNTIIRQLADSRPDVSLAVLLRREPSAEVFDGIDIQPVSADLADPNSFGRLNHAIGNCDVVIHSAALIHIGWKRRDESMAVNRDGTAAIVQACLDHGKPLVHIGTVDTLAAGKRREPADETTAKNAQNRKVPCSYVVSKQAGVEAVMAGVRRGLSAVLIHPGFMLGPWDFSPSSGRMIVEVSRKWRPIAPPGGCSLCDSRDVANGTIIATESLQEGRINSGRQYVLAGENWTYFELWREIAKRTGAGKPVMPAGPGQLLVGKLAARLKEKWSSQESDFNTAAIAIASQYHWYDSSRAKRELGYRSRDPHETLDDAVAWIQGRYM